MGGCCCCLSRAETLGTPIYIHCVQTSGEQEHLSSGQSRSSVASSGVFVDTNLDTSIPETFQVPPAPSAIDVDLEHSQNLHRSFGSGFNKNDHMHPSDSQCPVESVITDTHDSKTENDCENDSFKMTEDEPSKLNVTALAMDEKDDCPICLEEFDLENPQIFTKCKHHFHLSCILEWMERSDSCPICEKFMILGEEV